MSTAMQKLRALLPGQQNAALETKTAAVQRHSVVLEPEIGFQITLETQQIENQNGTEIGNCHSRTAVPELNVHLIAGRHLPTLFGFKIVQGYLIKVKLFPGSKRMDSSVQTNSWPKFNEHFRFPLAPDIKSSLKYTPRRSSRSSQLGELLEPDELFAGQFVVFTVYALLELPPESLNRFNKTYRSLRDKSSNFVQKVIENSTSGTTNPNATTNVESGHNKASTDESKRSKAKKNESSHNAMPPLTISESRRNIGSVTCYLEPKLFKRNTRTGLYSTEELWLPIKDITTTISKGPSNNNLTNSPKGIIELALELRDLSDTQPVRTYTMHSDECVGNTTNAKGNGDSSSRAGSNIKWQRMTSEMKRKMGISNVNSNHSKHNVVLRVTTARMRCANKVKDELESTAGSVYVKTTVFEHGIYVDAWKSNNFYPSLSTKWDVNDAATLEIPLQRLDQLENILVRTTLATKSKMGKKLVLGTVMVGLTAPVGSGMEQMQLLRDAALNELVVMWHCFQ